MAFDDDEGTEFGAAQILDGVGDFFDDDADVFGGAAEEAGFTQADQCPAKFGLEDDDEGDGDEGEEFVVKQAQALEGAVAAEEAAHDGEDDEDDQQALEGTGGAGALDETHDEPDHQPDDGKLDCDFPPLVGQQPALQALDAVEHAQRGVLSRRRLVDCNSFNRNFVCLVGASSRNLEKSGAEWVSLGMPRVVEYVTTPNPHALKCVLDVPVAGLGGASAEKVRSYREAGAAGDDALAVKLFAIAGVRNVLIAGPWITVGKAESATWKTLKPAIEAALA